ncbi:unnamed protein product [Allacma fusca]|uniref:Carboxypeptidase n=1 Tax=Allacma fusca TaxID=39272 RepID=A0A8J2P619_9HEXA|nr:unnamed protein product [Allacma fusca]
MYKNKYTLVLLLTIIFIVREVRSWALFLDEEMEIPKPKTSRGFSKLTREFHSSLKNSSSAGSGRDAGEALFLSNFISHGNASFKNSPEIWRDLALVKELSAVRSYSGYLTVNEEFGSNLFFWFFPAAYNPESAPVMLWLNGGPGTSSLFGLFVENGPFSIDDAGFLQYRKNAWTLTHSILYIDSPVGTGFSFTNNDEGYARSQDDVSRDLYEALIQFFSVFPEYLPRDFFVAGESYAGKYAPAIAYKIMKENSRRGSHLRINLKGLIIGSGFTDPYTQNDYGEYLYNMGLIDEADMVHFKNEEEKIRKLIKIQNWRLATEAVQSLILGFPHQERSYFENSTHFRFYMNILKTTVPQPFKNYAEFVARDDVRKALHVGTQSFTRTSRRVLSHMLPDICKSVKPAVERLLNDDIRMLVYAPQLDIIVPHTGVDKYVKSLRWVGSKQYLETPRKVWRVKDEIAGYVKTTRNLVHLVLRNAGHLAAYDQPEWAFEMVNTFTNGDPF